MAAVVAACIVVALPCSFQAMLHKAVIVLPMNRYARKESDLSYNVQDAGKMEKEKKKKKKMSASSH